MFFPAREDDFWVNGAAKQIARRTWTTTCVTGAAPRITP